MRPRQRHLSTPSRLNSQIQWLAIESGSRCSGLRREAAVKVDTSRYGGLAGVLRRPRLSAQANKALASESGLEGVLVELD